MIGDGVAAYAVEIVKRKDIDVDEERLGLPHCLDDIQQHIQNYRVFLVRGVDRELLQRVRMRLQRFQQFEVQERRGIAEVEPTQRFRP